MKIKSLQKLFLIPQRHVLAIMGFLAIVNAYQMRTCLNVAITEMVIKEPSDGNNVDKCPDPDVKPGDNSTVSTRPPDYGDGQFHWAPEMEGLILSSFYWGYVLTHIPGGWVADKFGGKYTLGIGILLTAVFTLLIPVAAKAGPGWLMACRIFTGLGEGTTFPALNNMLARWIPIQERSFVGSLVFSGSQIGTITGNTISGVLLSDYEGYWSIVFYFFGTIGIIWFVLFMLLCYSDPGSHPYVSDKEIGFLERHMPQFREKALPVPWRHILTSIPVWGLVAAQIGHDWAFFTVNTDLPKYMKEILRYNIKENGFLSSLPSLAMWIIALSSGYLVDWIIKKEWMGITLARKTFTSIAHIGPAVFLIIAVYVGCDRTTAVAMFTVGMAFMGTFYPGMKVNGLDLSPNYAGTLMAIVNGVGAISGIITPYLVSALTPDETKTQWRTVFWITMAVSIVTLILFVIMGSGEVQPWNDLGPKVDNESGGLKEPGKQDQGSATEKVQDEKEEKNGDEAVKDKLQTEDHKLRTASVKETGHDESVQGSATGKVQDEKEEKNGDEAVKEKLQKEDHKLRSDTEKVQDEKEEKNGDEAVKDKLQTEDHKLRTDTVKEVDEKRSEQREDSN